MSSPLATNRAVILAAHPNRDKVKVSPDIVDMGLDVLRAQPGELNATAIPDLPQARYGDYLHNISAFMKSTLIRNVTSTLSPTFLITWEDVSKTTLLPLIPPRLILAWPTSDVPEETLAQIREKLVVSETISGGKMALDYGPKKWSDLENVKPYKSNIRATAPVGYVNIKAFNVFRQLVLIISVLIHTQRYPAFIDKDHFTSIKDFITAEKGGKPATSTSMDVDVEMSAEENKQVGGGSEYSAPFGDTNVKKPGYMLVDMRKCTKDSLLFVESTQVSSDLSDSYGLWLPYYEKLSHYDKSTVPDFFDQFLQRSLGEDLEEVCMNIRHVRQEWGVCANTEAGKEFTHIVWAMRLALKAQAQLIPVFRGSKYRGCVLSGAGFTVDVASRAYRPVPKDELVKAIDTTDLHSLAMIQIANMLGHKDQKTAALATTSMNALRKVLVSAWSKEADKESILRHAKYLSFTNQPHWPVNESTIDKALSIIGDPNTSSVLLPDSIPVHYSCVLETDVVHIVWSAFGGMAPSFRIPGGHEFHLKEDMEVEQKMPGGAIRTKKIVRISVRMKSLDNAVADLKEVLSKHTIVNPLAAPKVRTSQQYQDKIFQAEKGKALLSSLRIFCGIQMDGGSKGKRKAGDEQEPARKKSKIVDMDGW